MLEKYNATDIIKITNNVYWTKDKEFWNINNFINKNWELLFNIVWVIEDLWVGKYKLLLKKLWYEWYVDKKWYYHIVNIKTWKEISQTSYEYYKIFEILAFIDSRNIVQSKLIPADEFKIFLKAWLDAYEYIVYLLGKKDKQLNLFNLPLHTHWISPLEYFSYLSLWLLKKQDILKYTKQVFNIDYFEKYYNNPWFKLLEDKKFKILLWEWKAKYYWGKILFVKGKKDNNKTIDNKSNLEKFNIDLNDIEGVNIESNIHIEPLPPKIKLEIDNNKLEIDNNKKDKEELSYKVYEISLKPSVENINLILEKVLPFVEKFELLHTKDKLEQEKIKERYEKLKEFLKKEKEKLKQKQEVKQKISSLKDDVISDSA